MFKVDADPGEVGLDADRLRRIDDVFRSYVDDGRLPGWTLAVTRRGKVAHLTHHGLADVDSGRPVGDDTLWRIYSMTKPITSVAAMMLYEQGVLELTDPVSQVHPGVRRAARLRRRLGGSAGHPPRGRADARVAPAHPHRGPHLRLPPRARRRRDVPGPGLRVRGAARARTSRRPARRGRGSRCCSTRARSGTTRWPPTCWAGSSRSCPGSRSTGSSPSASSARSA